MSDEEKEQLLKKITEQISKNIIRQSGVNDELVIPEAERNIRELLSNLSASNYISKDFRVEIKNKWQSWKKVHGSKAFVAFATYHTLVKPKFVKLNCSPKWYHRVLPFTIVQEKQIDLKTIKEEWYNQNLQFIKEYVDADIFFETTPPPIHWLVEHCVMYTNIKERVSFDSPEKRIYGSIYVQPTRNVETFRVDIEVTENGDTFKSF